MEDEVQTIVMKDYFTELQKEMNFEVEPMEMEDDFLEFTLAEIVEMEKKFKESKEKAISQVICQELATKFSCSPHRSEKSSVKWEQVQGWFQDKEKSLAAKVTSSSSCKAIVAYTNPAPRRKTPKVPVSTISADEAAVALSNLIFEAKSAKDYAWFDVGSFLNYKVHSSGEVAVRVRFAGFNKDEDEWINVQEAVRERSIPLQVSECHKVNVGDLVLCFREDEDYALYCDAHIVDIQRKLHDIEGCRCIFVVRYVTDDFEDKVVLNKLCCRPPSSASIPAIDLEPSVMSE
ncbi:protein SAWADEE HOMEODOMAIN HOMOLOG 1 isoform X1 [Olea europaea var. sylvestris]|nr:protein SAWADEE HOMEODOMAIN HOMOLOG 1 isoform X1 [Olea europaea var. sylvestris]